MLLYTCSQCTCMLCHHSGAGSCEQHREVSATRLPFKISECKPCSEVLIASASAAAAAAAAQTPPYS
eukprot:1144009-Pelagomonas_calceolata.AAC.4